MVVDLGGSVNYSEVGQTLGITKQAVGDLVKKMGFSGGTNGELIVAISNRYREQAAGRGGDLQGELTRAKIRDLNESADWRMIQKNKELGKLLLVEEVEPQLLAMVTAARQELLTLPGKLAGDLKSLHGVDVDVTLIEERIHDALNHLATSLHGNDAEHASAGDEIMGSTA